MTTATATATVTATAAPDRAAASAPGLPAGVVSFLDIVVAAALRQPDPAAGPARWGADRMAALSQRPPQPRWLQPTIRRMLTLPWDDDNWNDDARPTDPAAAANLLILLASILDDAAPTPIIVPTWRGGVQAEWHTNGVDLEIEVDPTEPAQYSFCGHTDDEEYEEPVAGNLEQLVGLAGRLSSGASGAGGSL